MGAIVDDIQLNNVSEIHPIGQNRRRGTTAGGNAAAEESGGFYRADDFRDR